MRKFQSALLAGAIVLLTQAQGQVMDRTKPPKTSELPAYKLPPVVETRLANGLQVLLVEDKRFPIVTARLGFEAGSKFDPQDLPGLSETTGALLTEGTATRSSRQIAEEMAAIGGSLNASSSPDSLLLAGSALSENLPKLIELLADVTRHASFPEDEVALRKQNRKQELAAARSEAAYLADEKFDQVVFAPHPYSRQDPTPQSIDKVTRAALVAFRDGHLAPNNAVLVLLGALPPKAEVLKLVEARFGDWAKKDTPAPPAAKFPEAKKSIVLVDRPGSVQADIRIGRIAVTRADQDYFPLLVANTILGGGTASRIFANIREKQGFAYDAHSSAIALRDSGTFDVVTQVRNEVLAPALEAAFHEMREIGAKDVSPEELATAKNYLSGIFVMRIETLDGLAGQIAATRMMGLPLTYMEQYTTRVRSVEPAALRAAAAKYTSPDAAAVIVVGDAKAIQAPLEKLGPVAVVKAEE
jgi:predicted Zn-dependent peptidase